MSLCPTCFGAGCVHCRPRSFRRDLRQTPPPSNSRTMPAAAPAPTLGTHGQPLLPDGTVDVALLCKRWDEQANRGAGEPRP